MCQKVRKKVRKLLTEQ